MYLSIPPHRFRGPRESHKETISDHEEVYGSNRVSEDSETLNTAIGDDSESVTIIYDDGSQTHIVPTELFSIEAISETKRYNQW